MQKFIILVLIIVLGPLAACSPRGELAYGGLPEARRLPIFVGTTRGLEAGGETNNFGFARHEGLQLARFDMAVPPARSPGTLSVPNPEKTVDPQHDFLVVQSRIYDRPDAFRASLRQELARNQSTAVVFVHGYNTNFAEGLYRFAQLGTDFGLTGVLVHYSWPSRARVMGYAYDHDSALFARDGLPQLLSELRRAGARRVLLVGHSMGGFLTMEALRQLAIARDTATLSAISGVVLISPDIDVDVFRAQAHRIGTLPQPFLVFTSQHDKALNISAQIAGEPTRVGNLADLNKVSDLHVTMIDTVAYDTQGGHFNIANSPELINLLKNWQGLARVLEGDQAQHHDPFASAVLSVRDATQIVLKPIEAIGDVLKK